MELRHLRYFVAVVEEGSLTTAAELRLHTSQPSLSRQIRDLEYQVGTELLSRSVHGVELTAAGKAFLDHARLALAQADAAVEAARRTTQPARKTFAIGFQTGHEMSWLPKAMHVLRDELKNIQVTVSSDYSPDLAEGLVRGRLDVAFLRVEPTFDLGYEVVDHEPLIVLMPSDHHLTSRDRGLSAPLRARHQTGSWSGQLGHGHLPGCVHPRVGAYASLCEKSAAVVRGQPSAGG
jgi:LysR family hca operon transcriptional activator